MLPTFGGTKETQNILLAPVVSRVTLIQNYQHPKGMHFGVTCSALLHIRFWCVAKRKQYSRNMTNVILNILDDFSSVDMEVFKHWIDCLVLVCVPVYEINAHFPEKTKEKTLKLCQHGFFGSPGPRKVKYSEGVKWSESFSVMSDSLWPHGLWNSPGQNTGAGSLSLLRWIFPNQELNWSLLHADGFFTNWAIREAQHLEGGWSHWDYPGWVICSGV